MPSRCRKWHIDLRPVRINPAPEHRPPPAIQRIKCPVLFSEPPTECSAAVVAVTFRVFIVHLVIDLPADDVCVASIMQRQLLNDPPRKLPIKRAIITVLPPR